jgi:hypothetical protein
MRNIYTEIVINAPQEKVWEQLINFQKYPDWNPFIRSIVGDCSVGSKLAAIIQPPNKKPMTFKPTIVTLQKYCFEWVGHLFIPGIFTGKHHFSLIKLSDAETKLIHQESFSGILSGLILNLIGADTTKGFQKMNEALKLRCEASS